MVVSGAGGGRRGGVYIKQHTADNTPQHAPDDRYDGGLAGDCCDEEAAAAAAALLLLALALAAEEKEAWLLLLAAAAAEDALAAALGLLSPASPSSSFVKSSSSARYGSSSESAIVPCRVVGLLLGVVCFSSQPSSSATHLWLVGDWMRRCSVSLGWI